MKCSKKQWTGIALLFKKYLSPVFVIPACFKRESHFRSPIKAFGDDHLLKNEKWALLLFLFIFLMFNALVFAEEPAPLCPGLASISGSKAYQQYALRPKTELSKLIYLIDRFGEAEMQILYENNYYTALFAARVVRVFLQIHYNQETAEYWIKHWATTSFPSGNPIWIKFPDGKFKLARELFTEELKQLDDAKKNQPAK